MTLGKNFTLALVGASLALSGCGIFKGGKKPRTPTVGERFDVLTYERKIEADPEVSNVTVTLPPPVSNSEWAQTGGRADRAMGHLNVGTNMQLLWSASIGSGSDSGRRLVSGPVVADGRVYTIDVRAEVRAYNMQTGRQLWAKRIARAGEKDAVAFGGGVAVAQGRLYATSGYGLVVAMDATTGQEIWRKDLKLPLRGGPSIADNRLFVVTQDNQVTALSTETGDSLWDAVGTVEATALLGATPPAIAADTAVVGFSSGELTAMRVENGRIVWQDALARTGRTAAMAALTDIDAPVVIDGGRVYAIGHGGRIAALELSTGQRLWERTLAGVSQPWVAGDFVFVVTLDSELVALTRGEGKARWVTQLPKYRNVEKRKNPIYWTGPVLAGDRLFLASSQGGIVAVSPYTGEVLQNFKHSGAVYLAPVVAGDMFFVLSDNGKLSAYK